MNPRQWLAVLALAGIASSAFSQAKNCGFYSCSEEEEKKWDQERQDDAYEQQRQSAEDFESRSAPGRAEQARQMAENDAALKALRARLLASPPLPPERNPLLGRWQVATGATPRGGDDLSQLMGMLSNPGAAMCEVVFGGGTTEFKPASWAASDSSGDDSLGPIQYRMQGSQVFALPDLGVPLLGFDIVDQGTIREFRLADCALVRVDAPIGGASAMSPQPVRPAPEVCRQTLLDQLGSSRVEQARQVIGRRFRETIDGKVPNQPAGLRIDARGSDCDDPRVNASLYDFDSDGVLQSITYVWARPPGPAPAPIFSERVATLSRFHSLPAPQSPGRLQADTSLGRLVLQDLPERNLLLEAYAAKQ
ncbi:MAG: hypothetical protein ABL989_01745 [Gammaproteobacteria bacterium]